MRSCSISTVDIERLLTIALQHDIDGFVGSTRAISALSLFIQNQFQLTIDLFRLLDSYEITPRKRHDVIDALMTLAEHYSDRPDTLARCDVFFSPSHKTITLTEIQPTLSFPAWVSQLVESGHEVSTEVHKLVRQYESYLEHLQGT